MNLSRNTINTFIGFFIFTFLMACSIIFWANNSEKNTASFRAALEFIHSDEETLQYTGGIEGTGFFMASKITRRVKSKSEAKYQFSVDGVENDIMVEIYLERPMDSVWIVKNYTFW